MSAPLNQITDLDGHEVWLLISDIQAIRIPPAPANPERTYATLWLRGQSIPIALTAERALKVAKGWALWLQERGEATDAGRGDHEL